MPLSDLRVLDLSRLLPGPYATMHLADLGADVIKVESPSKPDYLRLVPPLQDGCHIGFAALNRNKRSLVVRFETPEGAEVVRRLASRCDVLVESFRSGYLARFGLDYASLGQVNPSLVYCSLTGYGQACSTAGHDLNVLARSGLGWALSQQGEPLVPKVQVADMVAGMAAVQAILAALHRRARTGEGAHLDLALADAAYHMTMLRSAETMVSGSPESAELDTLAGTSPTYAYYRCADGKWLAVAALEEGFRKTLCAALELGEVSGELTSSPELKSRLTRLFSSRDRSHWLALLEPLDVCVEPVLDPLETVEQQWFQSRFPACGVRGRQGRQVPQPPGLLDPSFGARPRTAACDAGAHGLELLQWLGYSPEEIAELEAADQIVAES